MLYLHQVSPGGTTLLLLSTIASSTHAQISTNTTFDPLSYVDPLVGSTNGGNVFAGASLPYGLAKAVADVDGANTGGFATDGSNVTGFSSVHDSGTGGNPSLGNFPIFPQICPDDGDVNSCNFRIGDRKVLYDSSSVVGQPGYFSVKLSTGITAEMTVGERAALYRFTFAAEGNAAETHPLVLLDLTDLWQSRQNASISVDETTGRMTGNGTFLPSFGAGSYQLFFCADFVGAGIYETGVWVNNRAGTEPKDLFLTRGFNLFFQEGGAYVRFSALADNRILARVGVSFISSAQACSNAERDIPDPESSFETLVTRAQGAWRDKLSPVSINPGGASEDLQTSFWSGMYRAFMSPQNYTGENPKWDSGIPYFDSYYCIWDSFRVQHPLLTILDPSAQTQMVNSLLDIYQNEGWLSDCHMSLCNGWTQGGSNADVVLVDAHVKNLSVAIDWSVALEAIIQDAEVEPPEWSKQGRGGLTSWKNLNYIPYLDFDPIGSGTNSRSVSRTLEYAYNDFSLATLAQGLGRTDLYNKYFARSTNWQNLWKADQTSLLNDNNDTGFTGFFQPRYLNATWGFQDPIACSNLASFCSLTTNPSETFEASIWQYQFLVPQDMSSLISLMGGDGAFISRLDFFHTSGLADISNEPVFLTVYLYHYAGRPGLSTSRIHTYIPASFTATNAGLPGNDDGGAMGSFLFFSMMGLFPVAGQNVYLISAPFFESLSVTHPSTGKTATTRVAAGWDASYGSIYIQSVTVNGQPWAKSWIGHEFFTEGWTMELTLGTSESDWGTGAADRPPSYAASVAM